ncbi:MAG: M48 family metallopeptidase [Candidatus Colwellbacteria bacterium]|nr:M48 family metallopeptidase [Candidatus Colwellbacteria bacterium]
MPSLYTQKSESIRKTWILFTAFLIIVIGIGWVFAQAYGNPGILYFAVIFSIFMSFFSYWYSDKLVLKMYRAKPVEMKDNPELYRIVENLAITAGLPMPKVYIVPEQAPNAFATGRDPKHAVVAVTEGLLERLDRTELEGVLAHELGHVGNRDMLLSTAVVVLVGFISILADMFMRSAMWGGVRDSDDNRVGGIMILVALALSILAPIAATLIQLAISRRREFLADSTGALLTRYPEGLAMALEKISHDPTPMRRATSTTAHLWFDDPFESEGQKKKTPWWHRLFMTHPPVDERVQALRSLKI